MDLLLPSPRLRQPLGAIRGPLPGQNFIQQHLFDWHPSSLPTSPKFPLGDRRFERAWRKPEICSCQPLPVGP